MKLVIIISLLSLCSFYSFSQSRIEVKEQTEDIGGGNHNALVVKIYQCSEEEVIKEWKSLMKDYDGKITVKKEVFADNVKIKDMSDNTFDVFARAEANTDGDVILIAGFDLGGAYMGSSQHPKEFKAAKRILMDFAKDLSEKGFKHRLKNEEKALILMGKQKDFTIKESENMQRDIENYREKILKAEEKIKQNIEALKNKELEILNQQKLIDALNAKSVLQ